MPISSTSTDYAGRQVDMYISGPLNPLSSGQQQVNYAFGNPSQFIAGVQKLVQRYIISLINSGFIEQLLGSSNSNISIASQIFAANNWAIVKEFREYQTNNPGIPTDEQLNTVQAVNIASSSPDSIEFYLQLTTMAGETVSFIVPLPL